MSIDPTEHIGPAVAGRYERLSVIGSGGMGVVWRARDRDTGEIVALKLMTRAEEGDDLAHLDREADFLARIAYDAVPRYVGHGATDEGFRYLAMECLDGEDLRARLERGPLDVETTVQLGIGVAEALAVVHAHGVVHCDLKPSNLFLPSGDVLRVKLLDFGIARLAGAPHSLYDQGLLGTPFYMAPEQARGEQVLDGRTDLFSLGCILFECLVGRPPFVAEGPVAVLAKILFEDAPPLSSLRPGVPPALEAAVARLLAKNPAARTPDAAAAASQMEAMLGAPPRSLTLRPSPAALTQNERRLVSVVLAAGAPVMGSALHPGATLMIPAGLTPPVSALERIAREHGAELEVLGDGSIAAVLLGSGAPADLAAGAARCALALRAVLPSAQVALVTGWEVFTGSQPVGRVIDRAANLIHARARDPGRTLVDPMTAALLDDRFSLEGEDASPTLVGTREAVGEVRRLLGKPTELLGRERELDALSALWSSCVAEPAARAVLMTGAPGVGKSRLRSELVGRIQASGTGPGGASIPGPVEVWIARGDPVRRKAPLGLLGQLVRRAARLAEGEPLDLGRQKLAARVARCVAPAMQRRVAEFLGELVGIPFPADDSAQLRAARQAPVLMGDQMRRAWLDFIEAECRSHPILIVLEDLQWGDQPTVDLVDAALRVLADRPLTVLAVARPNVTDLFPALWSERGLTTLELGPLPRASCERLVREALGDALPDARVRLMLDRSAQNPFLLEELVRAVHEGRGDEVPDTVLAVMQSRLATLDPEERRLLRAGSLFGEVFWRGAVAALLGDLPDVAARFDDLERREWVVRRSDSKFHGEQEYAFSHGLIREAAYEMLTEEDQALGHRLAGAWLSEAGEVDAMVLAEHFEQGGESERAIGCFRAAAQQALGANDLPGAVARVERGIACGAAGEALGQLCLIGAEAYRWQGNFAQGKRWAERALGMSPKGSEPWFSALGEALASLVEPEDKGRILQMAELLDEVPSGRMGRSQVIAMSWMAIRLCLLGLRAQAEPLHRRLTGVEEELAGDPIPYGSIAMEGSFFYGLVVVDMSLCGERLLAAARRFDEAGDMRNAHYMRINLGHVYNEVGAYLDTVELLSTLRGEAERMGLWYIVAAATSHLSKAQMALGRLSEAEALARSALAAFGKQGDQRMAAVTRAYLGWILLRIGDLARAEEEARASVEALGQIPTLEPFALAVLASVRLARGCAPEALELARRAVDMVDQAEEGEALIRLVHVEARAATGDREGARDALLASKERLLDRAGKIEREAWRRSFLENVAENARTLALARSWLEREVGA